MKFSDLVPGKKKEQPIARRDDRMDPFTRLHHEMDRLFDEFRGQSPAETFGGEMTAWAPAVNLTESEKEFCVTAELPGMDEKDVDVEISHNVLSIKGEKKEEHKEEDKNRNVYRMERRYGSFLRQIELPSEVETDKAEASFKNGVLTIRLPKSGEAQKNVRKIDVKS